MKNNDGKNIVLDKEQYEDNPVQLIFESGEGTLQCISMNIGYSEIPNQNTYKANCSLARNVIVCFLKGYIIHNKRRVKQNNVNAIKLLQIASKIDNSFQSLRKECAFVEPYDMTSYCEKKRNKQA